MHTQMLINCHLVSGEGPAWTVLDPATGNALAQITEATEAQVDAAVRAADQAFDSWSQSTPKDRAMALLALADVIERNAEDFARLDEGTWEIAGTCVRRFTHRLSHKRWATRLIAVR